jgi:hypothetical protein
MRKLTSFGVIFALAAIATASDDKADRATLRGVKAVCTIVEVTAGSPLSKEHLQADLDGRLTANGISIDKNATTCLYLNVRPLPAMGRNNKPVGLYALDVSLQLMQTVTLARDPSTKAYASTWSVSNLATVPTGDAGATARQIAIDLAEKFVEAYRSVNPK